MKLRQKVLGLLTPCPERTLASMNAERFRTLQRVLDLRQPDLTVLMEEVHKPHNFAAILRTCDAVGVLQAHLVTRPDGVPMSRHIASGSSKWVQVEHHASIEGAIRFLKGEGFRLLVAHPDERATDYREVDFTQPAALLTNARNPHRHVSAFVHMPRNRPKTTIMNHS